jgi:hypothetical protein
VLQIIFLHQWEHAFTCGRDAHPWQLTPLVVHLAALDLVRAAVHGAEAGALVLDHDLLSLKTKTEIKSILSFFK